jgi:predicted enzyme related to lactoylglutathione lyase
MAANMKIVPTLPVVDYKRAKKFYQEKFGCVVTSEDPGPAGSLECHGGELYLYQRGPSKADHTLASFNVDDFDSEIRELRGKGVKFEEYDLPDMGIKTVNGIANMGDMKIAWFKDSEGNIISVSEYPKVKHSMPPERERVTTR